MKSIGRLSMWLVIVAISLVGCEKWGGRIDKLDSDRPSDVGPGFGQRGNGGSTDLGTLYGDLLFILRHDDGTPVYNNGFVQPLAFFEDEPFMNGDVQYLCEVNGEGEVIPNSYVSVDGNTGDYKTGVGPMEVEFGRTSIFRAPQRVLDQAIREALKGLSEVEITSLQLDFCGRLFGEIPTEVAGAFVEKTVDSPRENMAIYQSLIENEGFEGICEICDELNYQHLKKFFNEWQEPWWNVAAGALAAANDKTGVVCVDKIEYLHSFKNMIGVVGIPDTEGKLYFDFNDFPDYSRTIWEDVELGFLVWNGTYDPNNPKILSVSDIFEGVDGEFGYGEKPQFTYRSSDHIWFKDTNVGGFAQFADDCNQVLEYVHEDSNVIWVR